MSEKNRIVICVCHPDDEIIGCYKHVTNDENPPVILYMDTTISEERRQEALKLKEFTKISIQMFCNSIPPIFLNLSTKFYFPDPIYEIHPDHRRLGAMGEAYLRNKFDVTFYSINMNSPYIYETKNSQKKEELLNQIYPSQKSLWEYEKKYILFEGYNKWIIEP